jgi:hypothetical protein
MDWNSGRQEVPWVSGILYSRTRELAVTERRAALPQATMPRGGGRRKEEKQERESGGAGVIAASACQLQKYRSPRQTRQEKKKKRRADSLAFDDHQHRDAVSGNSLILLLRKRTTISRNFKQQIKYIGRLSKGTLYLENMTYRKFLSDTSPRVVS